ncbi:RNA guanine-N7 methyltransferase-activating subunit-like protein isoform X2 [Hemitrygon akajei]|uniref:RNA guanine-N7 methyltransferase-activating subunit-like protein isoform X2 n=1 Tax=Hemitrygon akajei TaxID=2704970 RepID=UPI003BF95F9F
MDGRSGSGRRMCSEAKLAPDYEEMFAHRFTEADTEYQEMVKSVADPPPIVEDWMNRPGGNRSTESVQELAVLSFAPGWLL